MSLIIEMLKRALILGAFFVSSDVFSCQVGEVSETVAVKFVYDGDTLYLKDGRKIRIIGINTPEMKHHKQTAEAFSAEATEALRELLYKNNNQIQLQIGIDAYDRYSRQLAHVFLVDGTNVSEWMLEHGFATTLFIPPNLGYLNCYTKAEKMAQNKQLNIWKLPRFNLHVADLIDKDRTGYLRVVGRISRVKRNKKSVIVYLRGGIRIKIVESDLHYFDQFKWDELQGKRVAVTGLLRKKGKSRTINVKHPVYFNVI